MVVGGRRPLDAHRRTAGRGAALRLGRRHEALLGGAGFTGIANELDHRDVWFADEEAWWAWKWSYSLRGVLEQQDEATLSQLRRDAEDRMRPFKQDAGLPCRLTANLVSAHRPDGG
jgi:hypothetical protein